MSLSPVAGSKISIGTVLDSKDTDFVAADFSAITWTEIKGWTERGTYGDTAALITEQIIGEGRDQKSKGTRNGGSMQNTFVIKKGVIDPGQAALAAAVASDSPFAIKIENNDKPVVGSAPKNSLEYFVALVMMAQVTGGGANTNRKINSTFEIVSNIVNVPASAT